MSLSWISRSVRIGLCCCGLVGLPACQQQVCQQTSFVAPATTADLAVPEPPPRDASDDFFDNGVIPQLKIELKESQAKKLREDARRYAKCKLIETLPDGETTYSDVAIKLKGAAGSFRELDDRPAFTLNMHKHLKGQTFHAMEKLHLGSRRLRRARRSRRSRSHEFLGRASRRPRG